MPVILGEIRRMMTQSQPGQIVLKTLSTKSITKRGWYSGSRCRPRVQTLAMPINKLKKNKKGY
jgi:hypothetical protein